MAFLKQNYGKSKNTEISLFVPKYKSQTNNRLSY